MQMMIEFLIGALLVLVLATIDAIATPVAGFVLFAGVWQVGKWVLYGSLTLRERWVLDQIERGKR